MRAAVSLGDRESAPSTPQPVALGVSSPHRAESATISGLPCKNAVSSASAWYSSNRWRDGFGSRPMLGTTTQRHEGSWTTLVAAAPL